MHSRYLLSALALLGLSSCNRYELFRVAGYEQTSYSNEVEILFVVDNSVSMFDESSSLALNFNAFIERLVDPEQGAAQTTETLTDAVDNYIQYVTERGRFLDYQLAVTTTSADPGSNQDPGDAGTLVGSPDVIGPDITADVEGTFQTTVLCDATCWPGACVDDEDDSCVPYDPEYECGDPPDDISWEYLDCVCGDDWSPPACGSGTEEGLESAFIALCRAVDDPPAACYDAGSPFESGDELSNAGLVREDSTVIVVIVTDEGDNSRRLSQGDEDPDVYLQLFDEFDNRITFVVIGPNYDEEARTFTCNSGGATTWGTLRYQTAAELTDGFFSSIAEEDATGECVQSDFAAHLEALGDLLNNLLNLFPLQSVPDPDTIVVFVDNVEIFETECVLDDAGDTICGDGWTYDPAENAIEFHGSDIPDYNARVRIFYRPLTDMPRSLPF